MNRNAKNLLEKAKESALLAVDVYNKPRTAFRTGGFVVLMCIAWTSLLHAVFERKKAKYFYKEGNGRYIRIDGEKKAWDLNKSATEYFGAADNPAQKNIQLFCELRNKIEHRFMPAIDPILSGECQALLLNFEDLLVEEFGENNSIVENLFVPLQLRSQPRKMPKFGDEKSVIEFIDQFRSSLSSDVASSQNFAFKAFFIPKLGNHRSSSDIAIEFVKINPDDPKDMAKYSKLMVGIKEKLVPVSNLDTYKPTTVYEMVGAKLKGKKIVILESRGRFLHWHTSMWKKHKVRPTNTKTEPAKTRSDYCRYDEPHKDYVYTKKWVEFLIAELTK